MDLDLSDSLLLLFFLIILAPLGTAASSNVFLIDLTITQDDQVTEKYVEIVNNEPRIPGGERGAYTLRMVDEDGKTVYSTPTHLSFSKVTFNGIEEQDETRFLARIPYDTNATTVILEHQGSTVATVDLPKQLCSKNKDDACLPYCIGKGIDPDCGDTTDGLPIMMILSILLAILLVAGGAYAYRSHREKQQDIDIDLNF